MSQGGAGRPGQLLHDDGVGRGCEVHRGQRLTFPNPVTAGRAGLGPRHRGRTGDEWVERPSERRTTDKLVDHEGLDFGGTGDTVEVGGKDLRYE